MASGYIAGGAIAGILIAILSGVPGPDKIDQLLRDWAEAANPFYAGPWADALALIPFAVLTGFLLLVAREKLLTPAKR